MLAATDPAQPFGAALPWPATDGRPARAAGALVVLADGQPLAYLERGAHRLLRFPDGVEDDRWAAALGAPGRPGRFRALELRTIDGVAVHEADADLRADPRARRLPARVQGLDPAPGPWLTRPSRPSTPIVAGLDAAMVVVTVAVGDERDGCLVGFHSQSSIDPRRYVVWLS